MNCGPIGTGLASPPSDDREGPLMFVNPALLHSGGSESLHAGDRAHQAAEHLSSADLRPQMFGDFAAAEDFHELTASAQVFHTRLLLQHRATLGAIGQGALVAAAGFTDVDDNNAANLRAVRCNSAT